MSAAPVKVVLTNREMSMAAECGIMRNLAAIIDNRPDANGFADETGGWNAHIEGACGEVAAAKLLGRFWSPTVNTFHAPDIAGSIQVRTRSRHDYDLLVRPSDDPVHAYVHVTGRAPTFLVWGFIIGEQARRAEWLKRHGGRPAAWFVPKAALGSVNELFLRGLVTA
jgi:hypothetical protein